MSEVLTLLADVKATVLRLPASREVFEGLSDDESMQAQRMLGEIARYTAASAAASAADLAWRSRTDLGHAGLAQRTGARTPESLVQQLTGSTGREAATLVRVGTMMQEAGSPPLHVPDADPSGVTVPWDGSGTPWLAGVGTAVVAGAIGVNSADAIRAGLGRPSDAVGVGELTEAANRLLAEAETLNADQLLKRARALRDEIDIAGVAERERVRHEQRSFRVFKRHDGMIRGDFLLAPESGGAEVLAAFEQVTAPRRGGPRFVDENEQARAQQVAHDPRTNEQLQADAFVELIRLGVESDSGRIVGSRKPAVRLLVTEEALRTRSGAGHVDGHPDAVSIPTIERNVCDAGVIPIMFDDDGQCINVGRELRLFTKRQRDGLAARDGGCRWPGCERPASWCEAHHLNHWWRDNGRTDLADGILLCRHHHMLVHNNHWEIRRVGGDYFLIPPRERDPQQTPVEMPTKSAALLDLQRRKRAG